MTEQKGYKTRQREMILKALTDNAARHLTADDIVSLLRQSGGSAGKTTVYRYLDRLVSEGVVRKYILEEGKSACYQYAGGGGSCSEHFHLRCLSCNRLFHVKCDYLSGISDHISSEHGFKIDSSRTVFYGICGECAAK